MPAGVSAWTPLANITLGSAQASVTFSSISGTYRDLVLVCHYLAASSGSYPVIRFNSDTSDANYRFVEVVGNGTSASSSSGNGLYFGNNYQPSDNTNPQPVVIQILDYSATDKHKTALLRTNASTQGVSILAGRWANTAAITSITINGNFVNIAAGSSFALYGVSS